MPLPGSLETGTGSPNHSFIQLWQDSWLGKTSSGFSTSGKRYIAKQLIHNSSTKSQFLGLKSQFLGFFEQKLLKFFEQTICLNYKYRETHTNNEKLKKMNTLAVYEKKFDFTSSTWKNMEN